MKFSQKLEHYKQLLQKQSDFNDTTFQKLKTNTMDYFNKQLQKALQQHHQKCNKKQKSLSEELKTIKFYEQNRQFPVKAEIFSLFAQIDKKIAYNHHILNSFDITISYPLTSENQTYIELNNQLTIYENYVKSIKPLLKVPQLQKYCKKTVQQFQRLTEQCSQLTKNAKKKQYSILTQEKIKGSVEDVCMKLAGINHIENLTISVITSKGILNTQDYTSLMQGIYSKRGLLNSLTLNLMDMEFSQQKCEIIKQKLTKMTLLSELKINNYYLQCKLGHFTDFNWHPYRKKVNINVTKLF